MSLHMDFFLEGIPYLYLLFARLLSLDKDAYRMLSVFPGFTELDWSPTVVQETRREVGRIRRFEKSSFK